MTDRYDDILKILHHAPVGQINAFGGMHGITAAALDEYINRHVYKLLEDILDNINDYFKDPDDAISVIADIVRQVYTAEIRKAQYDYGTFI